MTILNENRLFPSEPHTRAVARRLYANVRDLPIISPHGHADPCWFAEDRHFSDPAQLFVVPDHYIFRMLSLPTGWPERLTGFSSGRSFALGIFVGYKTLADSPHWKTGFSR